MGGTDSREVANGYESPIRVSLGFEPEWYCQRCDVDFSACCLKDPIYRYESLKKMKAELTKRFSQVACWNEAYQDDLATISGCYGIYVIPAVFGFSFLYAADRWPLLEPSQHISVDEIERLDVKTLLEGLFVEELFNQISIIESHWGKIHGYLHFQGVLNNAFHMRGQDIFLDMIDRPDQVHHFNSIICDVMIELAQKVQARQCLSGFSIDFLTVSNCTVNMISPEMYHEFVLRHDKKNAQSFGRFGVHTCYWNIDPYIDAFRKLSKLCYLDMGMESDLQRVKETFGETRRAVIYWPTKLMDASLKEIQKDMAKVYHKLAPCDVLMADMQASTSDARVIEFLKVCNAAESSR
jgi:hypothetical protein